MRAHAPGQFRPGRRHAGLPRPWRRWTVRTRLVVAIALVAGAALVLADAAAVWQLHSSLVHQLDRQVVEGERIYQRAPLAAATNNPRRFNAGPDVRAFYYSSDGGLHGIGDTAPASGPDLGTRDQVIAHVGGRPYTVPDRDGGSAWRVAANYHQQSGNIVVVALSQHQLDTTEQTLIGIDAAVLALMLLLLALVAAFLVRLGLSPLTEMEKTAEQIAGGDMSRRVENVDPHTEPGRLGLALNAMLARIEAALAESTASEQRLRQFLADASHELRTPLTSIQGFAELYRRGGARPGPQLDEAMARIEAEADRMALLVSDLMLLARLDRERPLERNRVDLLELAADAVRDAHARVPGRFITLRCDDEAFGAAGPATVTGDEARLRQVATNLLANALQHTPAQATIMVRVSRDAVDGGPPTVAVGDGPGHGAPLAVLEVTDTGPGLSVDQAGRVFERLYRADASRQRASGGAGLGLAIVAAIVVAHGGRVELRTRPGSGSSFRVLLPAEEERGDVSDYGSDNL